MSMFLWGKPDADDPAARARSRLSPPAAAPTADIIKADKLQAKNDRPEIREKSISKPRSIISIWNSPRTISCRVSIWKRRRPGLRRNLCWDWAIGSGAELRIPILQRRSRGEVMEAQAQADRLVLVQKYREQQVVVDVDNAVSAIERAKERVAAAAESLRMAKTLEEGERFRFSLGATSVLFVNLREREFRRFGDATRPGQGGLPEGSRPLSMGDGILGQSQPSAVPVNYRVGASLSK